MRIYHHKHGLLFLYPWPEAVALCRLMAQQAGQPELSLDEILSLGERAELGPDEFPDLDAPVVEVPPDLMAGMEPPKGEPVELPGHVSCPSCGFPVRIEPEPEPKPKAKT